MSESETKRTSWAVTTLAAVCIAACGGGEAPGGSADASTDAPDSNADTTRDTATDSAADAPGSDAESDEGTDSGEDPCDSMCTPDLISLVADCLDPDFDAEGCREICTEDLSAGEAACIGAATSCSDLEVCFEGGRECELDAFAMPESEGDLLLQDVPEGSPFAEFFGRFVTVFGVYIVAPDGADESKVLHASTMMAEYLDNDEDGAPDNPAVVASMAERNATLIMFETSDDLDRSGLFDSELGSCIWGQDLSTSETRRPGEFDITLEEVLHLVQSSGYSAAYPEAFNTSDGLLAEAMDIARGGHFEQIPDAYPEGAWYHYDDPTCGYGCMASEYFYWGLTTLLGGQSGSANPGRCDEIAREWEFCTPEEFEAGDVALFELLTDSGYSLPTVLPDGNYAPE